MEANKVFEIVEELDTWTKIRCKFCKKNYSLDKGCRIKDIIFDDSYCCDYCKGKNND